MLLNLLLYLSLFATAVSSDATFEGRLAFVASRTYRSANILKLGISFPSKEDDSNNNGGGGDDDDDEQQQFTDEEDAAFDAHDISDAGFEAAAMERAVMIANEWKERTKMKNRMNSKHRRKEKMGAKRMIDSKPSKGRTKMVYQNVRVVDDHYDSYKAAEKSYENLEKLIKSAAEAEKKDLGTLAHVFSNEDAADLAILMLENAHTIAALKILEMEGTITSATKAFEAAATKGQVAREISCQAAADAKAAEDRVASIENFSNVEEVTERRRDLSVSHAAHRAMDDANSVAAAADATMAKALEDKSRAGRELETLKRNEAELEADIKELRSIVREANEERRKRKEGWH